MLSFLGTFMIIQNFTSSYQWFIGWCHKIKVVWPPCFTCVSVYKVLKL